MAKERILKFGQCFMKLQAYESWVKGIPSLWTTQYISHHSYRLRITQNSLRNSNIIHYVKTKPFYLLLHFFQKWSNKWLQLYLLSISCSRYSPTPSSDNVVYVYPLLSCTI